MVALARQTQRSPTPADPHGYGTRTSRTRIKFISPITPSARWFKQLALHRLGQSLPWQAPPRGAEATSDERSLLLEREVVGKRRTKRGGRRQMTGGRVFCLHSTKKRKTRQNDYNKHAAFITNEKEDRLRIEHMMCKQTPTFLNEMSS